MPTPKEFEDLRRAGRPTAGEAWASALDHVRSGAYRRETFDDELTARAVSALGGWSVLALSDESKLPFLERRFAEHFEAIREAADVRDGMPLLGYSTPSRRLEDSSEQ
jgi:hypothetical protein